MTMYAAVLLIYGILFQTVHSNTCKPFQVNKNNLDIALVGHSVMDMNHTKHHDCARTCMSIAICKSIDYDRKEKTCKLNDVDRSSDDLLLFMKKEGSIFSEISEWPSTMARSCSKRPCQANQMCFDKDDSYVCRDIICDIVKKIEHGKIQTYTASKNKFLDTALVQCDIGYVPSQHAVLCQASGQWQNATCDRLSDCKEIHNEFPEAKSGLYEIKLWRSGKILTANCDMETDGGGWTIFQRRTDGSVDFYRNFAEYENGFGYSDGELWLGLKNIQELADHGSSQMRIDLTNVNDVTKYESFQDFKLADEMKYTLNIGLRDASENWINTAFEYSNLAPFSTFDRDLDSSGGNCAVDRHGGWWYKSCSRVSLNGFYSPGTICMVSGAKKVLCGFLHSGIGLKRSSMMLRRT